MKRKKQYRVQSRGFLGMFRRGWGYGTVASYSPWRTEFVTPDLEKARAYVEERRAIGMRQWKIWFGTELIEEVK